MARGPDDYDYEVQLFQDPGGSVERIKEDIRQEYRAEQGRIIAARFLAAHPDLKEDEVVVQAHAMRASGKWGDGPADDTFQTELANRTRRAMTDSGGLPQNSMSAIIEQRRVAREAAHVKDYYDRDRSNRGRGA